MKSCWIKSWAIRRDLRARVTGQRASSGVGQEGRGEEVRGADEGDEAGGAGEGSIRVWAGCSGGCRLRELGMGRSWKMMRVFNVRSRLGSRTAHHAFRRVHRASSVRRVDVSSGYWLIGNDLRENRYDRSAPVLDVGSPRRGPRLCHWTWPGLALRLMSSICIIISVPVTTSDIEE